MPSQTNKTLSLPTVQPADEGDYTVVVSNSEGLAVSDQARLWVVPPANQAIRRDYTNATGLPLQADKTNVVIVIATTTSWAPAFGGTTTFNDTLAAFYSPIRATIALQGSAAILNWTGAAPPYAVQHATDLVKGDWADLLINADPPVSLPTESAAGFYRVVGK